MVNIFTLKFWQRSVIFLFTNSPPLSTSIALGAPNLVNIHDSSNGLIMDSGRLSGTMNADVNLENTSIMYKMITPCFGHILRSMQTVSLKFCAIGADTLGLALVFLCMRYVVFSSIMFAVCSFEHDFHCGLAGVS